MSERAAGDRGPDETGVVFNVQGYSLHDGPGIRTVVFLKGCPLRCAWCCNPESQRPEPDVEFLALDCIHCGRCVAACSRDAISHDLFAPAESKVDREMLLDAQRHPERYRDLFVRVGGYSALFIELSREVQDAIIARAEQTL